MALIDLRSNLSWYAQFPLGNRVNAEVSGFNGFRLTPSYPAESRFKLNDNLTINADIGGFSDVGFFQPPRPVTNELKVSAGGETTPITVFSRKNQIGMQGSAFNGLLGFRFDHSGKKRTGFFRTDPSGGTTYGDQFSPLDTTGLADSYTGEQDVSIIGQTPFKSSPIEQQYNKFNIQSEAHDPFGLGVRSVVQPSGIQRRGVIETSTFGLGDDSTSVVPELTDYPIGGFNTHAAYQRQSDQRRTAYNNSPRGQASILKTTVLKQQGYNNTGLLGSSPLDLGGEQKKLESLRKQSHADYVAGKETDSYEIGQDRLKQNELYSGTNAGNNNLIQLQNNYGLQGNEFNSFTGENPQPANLNNNLSTITNPNEPNTGTFNQQIGDTNTPTDSSLERLYGGGSTNTSLDAQFGLGTPQEQLRYSYSPNVSTSPYGGANDPSGQKASGGQEIIPSLQKDGVGKDELKPENWKKTEEREKFPKESGQSGYTNFQTNGYSDLSSAAKKRASKTTQNHDFLKKGDYSGKEETLANKDYKSITRDAVYPHATKEGGQFKGGGLDTNEQGMHKFGAMSYDSIPSPTSGDQRSKLSKDNTSLKQPKHGGYHGSYDKPGSVGKIGTSYSPGGGFTNRVDYDGGKGESDGKNPGDMEFMFKSVQGGSDIKFQAFITGLSENYAPSWDGQADQGRADARYLYTAFERTLTVDFEFRIMSSDNFKTMWQKLQDLAKITYPMYKGSGFHGQICEVTIGKMYKKYKMIITDLSYSWDNETSWDLKEHAPMSCAVSLSLTILGDENQGKKFEKDNTLYEHLK